MVDIKKIPHLLSKYVEISNSKLKRKIPLSLTIYFLIFEHLCGIEFGFTAQLKKQFRFVAKIITRAVFLIILVNLLYGVVEVYEFWVWVNFVEYGAYFCIFRLCSYRFYDFLIDINRILDITTAEKGVLFATTVFCFVMFITKIVFVVIRCVFQTNSDCVTLGIHHYVFFTWTSAALENSLTTVIRIAIYYYIYCYLKHLKKNMAKKEIKISDIAGRYKSVADLYEKVLPLYNGLTICGLCFDVPKLLAGLWYLLINIKQQDKWFSFTYTTVSIMQIVLKLSLPAIAVEMVGSQVDAVKLSLHETLKDNIDPNERTEILYLLRFMKARQLQQMVCRVVPIDAQLLIALFGLCSSYFIVILQFSKLFD